MIHEPTIFATPSFSRGVDRASEAITCSKNSSWPLSAVQSHLAIGRRVQLGRSHRNSWVALHQRSRMGEAISTIGDLGSLESSETRETKKLWQRSGDVGDSNRYLPSAGFRTGLYHLVSGQVGSTPSTTFFSKIAQSGNHSSHPRSTWSALLNGANLVRKQRPGLRSKKNAIIGLYRHPPKRGIVVCFDEFGPLQTIPRGGQQWGKRPALRPDRYRRNGTLQWFGAFCPTTGQSVGRGTRQKDGESCKRFWEEVMLPFWSKGSIHLIMDNLSAHMKALKILPSKMRRRVHVYWLPTNSFWLNLIESYFATLQRTALNNTDYKTPEEIEQSLKRGVQYLNLNPKPYV